MIDKFNAIEYALKKAAKGSIDLTIWKGDNPGDIYSALTVDSHLYEAPELYTTDDDQIANMAGGILKYNGQEAYWRFVKKYFRKEPPEAEKKFRAMLMLQYKGKVELAQVIADSIEEDRLRKKYYPQLLNKIENDSYRHKLQENAKRPRNPHYDEAMRIARLTWQKFPGASKGAMCKKLQEHFKEGVSIDTLDRWIKKAKIQPPQPTAHTSFTLVLIEGA